jgi:hypothetical protein
MAEFQIALFIFNMAYKYLLMKKDFVQVSEPLSYILKMVSVVMTSNRKIKSLPKWIQEIGSSK